MKAVGALAVYYSPNLAAKEDFKRTRLARRDCLRGRSAESSWKAGSASAPPVTVIAADRSFMVSQQIRSQIRFS